MIKKYTFSGTKDIDFLSRGYTEISSVLMITVRYYRSMKKIFPVFLGSRLIIHLTLFILFAILNNDNGIR